MLVLALGFGGALEGESTNEMGCPVNLYPVGRFRCDYGECGFRQHMCTTVTIGERGADRLLIIHIFVYIYIYMFTRTSKEPSAFGSNALRCIRAHELGKAAQLRGACRVGIARARSSAQAHVAT